MPSKKKTTRMILQQFLLWSETKKNQKWLVTPAKTTSQSPHSNSSNNPIPSAYQGSCSEVNGTRLLLKFLSHLTRQLSQCYECPLKLEVAMLKMFSTLSVAVPLSPTLK